MAAKAPVSRCAQGFGIGSFQALLQHEGAQSRDGDAVDGKENENAAPAVEGQEDGPQCGSHDRGQDEDGHDQAHHPCHGRPLEQVADDGTADHGACPGTEALGHPQQEQRVHRGADGTADGRGDIDSHAGEECRPAPVAVRERAPDRLAQREAHEEGGHGELGPGEVRAERRHH
jgi:hypothetical protein